MTHWPAVLQACCVAPLHLVAFAAWHVVPSQQAPSHTNPPAQLAAHWCVEVLQAVPVGQSPGPLQPQEPVDSQADPTDAPVQIEHFPLFVPQAAPAVPEAHCPVVELQQPVLHVAEVLQLFEQTCVLKLHAWYSGQSVEAAQPHCPWVQWLLPVQAPQAAPWVPHWPSLSVVTQFPLESQQPVAQFADVHLSTQLPPVQVCAPVHVLHDPPPLPHVEDPSSVWHWPSNPQQPAAQLN